MFLTILLVLQVVCSAFIGFYCLTVMRKQRGGKTMIAKDDQRELMRFRQLWSVKLTTPLTELTRPSDLSQVVGQPNGIKALRAALCGKNPQHVIIYGPPGVGKTAAARVVMEEAKKAADSPFSVSSKFVEIDATTLRFDDRGIADPLMGSVHDPIYQGAGSYGQTGVPQPKMGAVTKAHGGVLFIDEIGELHPVQMNKLLKVLEDRMVPLESTYYNAYDNNIPHHIHEMFERGLPADFRLIGATTRRPDELPAALRSRCVEIYFDALDGTQLRVLAQNAADRLGCTLTETALSLIPQYAQNGRDAVNIIQNAASISALDCHATIDRADVEWVVRTGRYTPKPNHKVQAGAMVGCVTGLAVSGEGVGTILEIEATAIRVPHGTGKVTVTGIVEQEEYSNRSQTLRKQSSASCSVENVLTVLQKCCNVEPKDYNIHINIPCNAPVDGPSAGIAILCAVYSAITGIPVDTRLAMTGELSIKGLVKPVGGVVEKLQAAQSAGATRVLIPAQNMQQNFGEIAVEITPVAKVEQVFAEVFGTGQIGTVSPTMTGGDGGFIAAVGMEGLA